MIIPPALQFVGSKQEVNLVIKMLFSMKSWQKKKILQLEVWKASTHPHLGREQPWRSTVVCSAWALHVRSLTVSTGQRRGNLKKPMRPNK